MNTHNIHRRWKAWAVGVAFTVVVGASGYVVFSSDHSSEATAKEQREPSQNRRGQFGELLAAVRDALTGTFGRSVAMIENQRAAFVVLPQRGPVTGVPLRGSGMNSQIEKGRVVKVDRSALQGWGKLKEGQQVALPSLDGEPLAGEVHLRMEDNGWVRFGGTLAGKEGTFSLNTNFDQVSGAILLPESGRAYEIRSDASGEVLVVERRLSSLVCWPYSVPDTAAAAFDGSTTSTSGGVVPAINTRPEAKGLIYIDFDGEVVSDPSWNGGRTITAAPSRLTADQIREVVARVAEDYAPFDIAISTVRADYDVAPVGRRMRVIVTPTTTAAPGAGGVAMIGSWSDAGVWLSSTVPAWVFNSTPKAVAEGVSHEAGHTFGLSHDGTLNSEYYSGHGGGLEVPTSWAPIMGNSYGRSLTQWSKGEYRNANNTEDDLAIISSQLNGVGYRTDINPAKSLSFSGNTFEASGMLLSSVTTDVYEFQTSGGAVIASVNPLSPQYSNVDLRLELRDSADRTLAVSSPTDALAASINKSGLVAGTYRWVVRGAGTGAAPAGGYTTGYSEYGSIGGYKISGSVGNVIAVPSFTSPLSAVGVVGQPFLYQIKASPDSVIAAPTGDLPTGIVYDPVTKSLTGRSTVSGSWDVVLTASNKVGTATQVLKLRIDDAALPLASAIGGVTSLSTSPAQAPWVGATVTRGDGQPGVVAVSGRLADGGSSKLQFGVPGQSVLSFWWKVSSESGYDGVVCRINGRVASDSDTGAALALSGESGWVQQHVRLESAGTYSVEFTYSKDAFVTKGLDRAWVYGVEVAKLPVFKDTGLFPKSLALKPGDKEFTLFMVADGASSYQWKKDGVALIDGATDGHSVTGATTSKLTVSGVLGSDSGYYSLEAGNAFGKVQGPRAEVVVGGPPEITSQPVTPIGLKVGDAMTLSVSASGPQPMFYLWMKNGATVQWGPSSVFQVRSVKSYTAGTYQVYAVNRYGYVQSVEVPVVVGISSAGVKAR
ncbi:MAG: immunoglobulin domain-containing protein [Verrucomicrobiota bacterium]